MKETPLTSKLKTHIRKAEISDLPEIVAIYNQAIPTHRSTANTIPWTVEGRTPWFTEHQPDKHPIFVAEVDWQAVGWCSLSPYRPGRLALRFTAEISYYIESRYQRQGVGQSLIRYAIEACPALNIKNIIAVIMDRNEPSRKLLEKLGFEQWAYLPRVLDFDGDEFGEYYYGMRVEHTMG
jgi:phosphinothricin acetyltransferase